MSFDWSMYFHLAQELERQATSSLYQDAMLRSAISRAYYAAFIKARNHLRDRENLSLPLDGSAHRHVAGVFKRSPTKERRKIGVILERMRLDRRKADYNDVVLDLNNTVRENLKRAKEYWLI